MRLWSLHPSLLDRRALVAGWREALLAQKVLAGGTRGYTHHPQLQRFRATDDPLAAIATYLHALADDADARGYSFDRSRVLQPAADGLRLTVTAGQLDYEWQHLCAKVGARDPEWFVAVVVAARPAPHPLFDVVPGDVERWEVR